MKKRNRTLGLSAADDDVGGAPRAGDSTSEIAQLVKSELKLRKPSGATFPWWGFFQLFIKASLGAVIYEIGVAKVISQGRG